MSPTLLLAMGLVVSTVGRATGQDVLLDIPGPAGTTSQADAGAGVGDWNGDGVIDLAIGAPHDATTAADGGAVRIHSGKDGSVLLLIPGESGGDLFGFPVVRTPDLNGDGIADFAVGALGASYSGVATGSVYLLDGSTGARLHRIDGPAGHVTFGSPLGPTGDLDGDGICDLLIGETDQGDVVHLFSGAIGSLLFDLKGLSGDGFGAAACAISDLDGDGARDILVGVPYHYDVLGHRVGAAYVLSSRTGAYLRTHYGKYQFESLGAGVASLGDLDGDGIEEYAIAAMTDPKLWGGMVQVVSGATGSLLAQIDTTSRSELILPQVINAGDLNGDGANDCAIGGYWIDAAGSYHAAAFLVSGKTFIPFDRIETQDDSLLLAPFGDLDGNGFADLIVGSLDSSLDGRVRVYSGDDLWLNATPSQPIAGTNLELDTREGTPGALTLLVLEAVDGTPAFQVVGGLASFDGTGGREVTGLVAAGLAGHQFTLRSYAVGGPGRVLVSATQEVDCK
jgi:FG-GAP repeat protein